MSFKRQVPAVDLAMYVQAIPLLVKHPSILAVPLLAAVMAILINAAVAPMLTNAVGGAGAGLFGILVQLIYLWAFGIAIIQASQVWRNRRGSFDEAWEEGRTKFGGILLAAIGFQFVVWAASYIGSFFGGVLGLVLGAVAAFFLIYTIPAAAIGGMPGALAISASIRAVRANVPGSILLAVVFFILWVVVPGYLPYVTATLSQVLYSLVMAVYEAIVLGYLAFPFAKQYDDVAFRGLW
jgi:uncharacterized membrane protein